MGIQVEWLAPDTNCIYLTVEGSWTWDDYRVAMSTAHEMLDKVPYEFVDYILDLRQAPTLPSNILSRMKNVSRNQHPKSRNMVVVGAGRFPEMMFGIMEQIMPQRMTHITLVATPDEALALLQEKPARFEG